MKKHKETKSETESRNEAEKPDQPRDGAIQEIPAATGMDSASGEAQSALSAGQELEQLRQKWQRLAADYQNYQKRVQRQLEQTSQIAQENILRGLIPVLDNFSHTLEKGSGSDVNSVLQGIQIVYDHLMNTLSGLGMKRIETKPGIPFNPQFHEAVMQEETAEFPPGTVVRELAGGYCMNDRALRPAKVSVSKGAVNAEHPQGRDSSPETGAPD